jgi:hypothetical protein
MGLHRIWEHIDMHRISILFFIGLITHASAIVVQDYTTAEAPPPGLDWSYVYNYKGSSAVAVGANWLLTARHVADDGGDGSVLVDGTVYNQQEIVLHASADLGLVRYDKTFPGFYPLYIDDLLSNPKLNVILVGYGSTGSVYDSGWTDNGSGGGTRRWGTQEINATAIDGFWMSFGLDDTAYEAGTGVGDSGGGVFYDDGGAWKLAGIITKRVRVDELYKSTFAIGMSDYADWIAATIPEPAMTRLMGLGTFGLFLMRAGTRRKPQGCGGLLPPRKVYTCDHLTLDPEMQRSCFRMQDLLIELGCSLKTLLQPVKELMCSRYRAYDRLFWNHMVAVHERRTARRAAKIPLRRKALAWLDVCLERIMK